MKNFIKISGILVGVLLICLYIAFLFVLPKKVNLNEYKQIVVESAKNQAKLDVDFSDAKLFTTPFLGVGAKIENISVKLPDESLLFSAESIKTTLSLPNLLLLNVKISEFDAEKPFLNLEIADNSYFKVLKLAEDLINENKQKQIGKIKQEPEKQPFYMSLIRINVPSLKLKNYKILVNDLKSEHYLDLNGKELLLGYFNGKKARVKGDAHLFSDTNEKITANIDIRTFLPKPAETSDSEDDDALRVEFSFVNPVTLFRKYNLKAVLDAKIKVSEKKEQITSDGYLNIDGLTLTVSDIRLPESYLHAKTHGSKINLDTDINITDKAKISAVGNLTYGKNPKTDISVKTGKIYFQDMLDFSKALLNSLSITNDMDKYSANGFLEADTYIKTNFKKLKSNGSIICKDGELSIKGMGKVISDTNINLLLNNNILNIDKSSLYIGDAKVLLDGSIDNSSYADVSVKTETLSLPFIFRAFADNNTKESYDLKSGNVKADIFVKGKLKEAAANIELIVNNLIFADRANNFIIENDKLEAKLLAGAKAVSAAVINNGFKFALPKTKSNISVPKLGINFAENNISVDENKIILNNNSELTYNGNIVNVQNPKSLSFNLFGNIDTKDIVKFAGQDTERFFGKKGFIPFKLSLSGNNTKQTLFVEGLSDKDNFITPVNFNLLQDKPAVLQAMIDFKTGRFKIKNTGLFERNIITDEKGNQKTVLEEIIGINGTVAGNMINLIQMNIPHHITGNIDLFPSSMFTFEKSRLLIYGRTAMPRIRGSLNFTGISIPELLTNLEKMHLKFEGQDAELKINNLLLNNSDITLSTVFKFIQSGKFKIDRLNLKSKLINVDNMMKINDCTAKYFPPSNPQKSNSKNTSDDIPLIISDGNISIEQLKTGNIEAQNIKSKLYLDNNILSVKELDTSAFKGKIGGDVDVNLLNSDIIVRMSGENIDVQKAMEDAAGIKGTLSGTTDFSVNLSLGGSTYEQQMKSLKGNIVFDAKDGQYGPFAKLENLIIAENIRESEFFQSALGGIMQKITTIDTTHFDRLTGKISFDKGICKIEEMTSSGSVLMMHIFGEFDLLKNTIDMKVRAKMTSLIAEMLGPIAAINPIKLLNSAASTNVVTAKAFSLFCETLDEEEINKIPSFNDKYVDTTSNANRFQLVAKGDVAKPLTLIKSFKWITTPIDFQKASEFVASIPNPVEGSTAETIEEVIAENEKLEQEKKTFKYKVKHIFKKSDNKKNKP